MCEILDVVDDERETLAVLGQQFGIAQHLCRTLLGQITGRLASSRTQQVESLPIEANRVVRAVEEDEADNFPAMRQWDSEPHFFGSEVPCLLRRAGRVLLYPAAISKTGNKRIADR